MGIFWWRAGAATVLSGTGLLVLGFYGLSGFGAPSPTPIERALLRVFFWGTLGSFLAGLLMLVPSRRWGAMVSLALGGLFFVLSGLLSLEVWRRAPSTEQFVWGILVSILAATPYAIAGYMGWRIRGKT